MLFFALYPVSSLLPLTGVYSTSYIYIYIYILGVMLWLTLFHGSGETLNKKPLRLETRDSIINVQTWRMKHASLLFKLLVYM